MQVAETRLSDNQLLLTVGGCKLSLNKVGITQGSNKKEDAFIIGSDALFKYGSVTEHKDNNVVKAIGIFKDVPLSEFSLASTGVILETNQLVDIKIEVNMNTDAEYCYSLTVTTAPEQPPCGPMGASFFFQDLNIKKCGEDYGD